MSRQTSEPTVLVFPDGFRMSISTDNGTTFEDVGVLSSGGDLVYNWDEFRVDAGNYRALVDKYINPTIALSPSEILDFDPANIARIFPGFMKTGTATTPTTGTTAEFAGTERYGTLTRCIIKLSHYTVNASQGTETDTDIDWEITLHNARVDAGATMSLKGADGTDLSTLSASFTSEPDPEEMSSFFSYFHA